MRSIGVISDTHGLLRPEALTALEESDLILHAGDVGDVQILDHLRAVAPVHAVCGNTDWGEVRAQLPVTKAVDLGAPDGTFGEGGPDGPVAYILHDLEDLDLDPVSAGVAVVITGHTHRPLVERRAGVTYLNPGSAGPRRFSLPVTVARLVVDRARVEVEIIDLGVSL
jgi:putative phosphoesterase